MDDDESPRVIPETEDLVYSAGRYLNQQPEYRHIISSEVKLQLDNEVATGQVRRRSLCPCGSTVGIYN